MTGYTIDYIQPMIDEDHKDPLWYGGRVCEIKYKGYTFILGAYGDVVATLLLGKDNEVYVKDKYNAGRFREEMSPYIKSDYEISKLESDGTLTLDNNNWFEVLIDDPNGGQHDLGWLTDSFAYDESVEEIIENMDAVISEIENGN